MAWGSSSSTQHPVGWPAIREAVRRRDVVCQWPIDQLGVCASTDRLQVDRRTPWAEAGGQPVRVEDCWLLCHQHHALKTGREAARGRARRRESARRPRERHPGLRD